MSFAKIMKQSLDGLIIYQTLQAFYFSQFFDYLKENEYRVAFRILQLHSHWFGIIQWITRHKFATVKACWISCAFFQFVLRNTGKMCCDKGFKASYETWKWNLIDRAKKLSDAELIIKFASSSKGFKIWNSHSLRRENISFADLGKWKIYYFLK